MTSTPIVPHFQVWKQRVSRHFRRPRPSLHELAQHPGHMPRFVRDSPIAQHYLRLLGPIDWTRFPERDLETDWVTPAIPFAAFAAACLIKLDQGLVYMSSLRRYLVDHPSLLWMLSFPLVISPRSAYGFDVEASLPTARHLTRLLRQIPNACFQYLLDETVRLLMSELLDLAPDFGCCISLDTKHILAWVKENNPKAYVKNRYDKEQQPSGDPDCRLGCKRKQNQRSRHETLETPLGDAVPASGVQVGEYYWGYGSGVVSTKVPSWGEFVLAELTQPFDCGDATYFHPLMADVERRLGFHPPFGAFDAAYDAFYVYEPFHRAGGFAAVPFVVKGKTKKRTFSAEGLPLCNAGLPMPLQFTYTSRTTSIIEHEKGRYVCPLVYPERSGQVCPIADPHWPKGGCSTTLATSIGARIRHQLDRDSDDYKEIYKQRTATERINALAKELGIERPKLRNQQAIANQNTLIYVLLNLRALQRVRQRKADLS
jgi:hypothetical protein